MANPIENGSQTEVHHLRGDLSAVVSYIARDLTRYSSYELHPVHPAEVDFERHMETGQQLPYPTTIVPISHQSLLDRHGDTGTPLHDTVFSEKVAEELVNHSIGINAVVIQPHL